MTHLERKRMAEQLNLPLGEPVKFYLYDQNNSGGFFVYDENFGENVLIEARSSGEANEKMQDMGCYGHSVCDCCGERWSMFYGEDSWGVHKTAEEVIAKYAPPAVIDPQRPWERGQQLVIHYLDGRIEWHHKDVTRY
jgi:hypothetical protein